MVTSSSKWKQSYNDWRLWMGRASDGGGSRFVSPIADDTICPACPEDTLSPPTTLTVPVSVVVRDRATSGDARAVTGVTSLRGDSTIVSLLGVCGDVRGLMFWRSE